MTETEFRIKYSEIMQQFQFIEFNLTRICAALVMETPKNWDEKFNKYDADPMGRLIYILENNKNNLSKEYITDSKIRKLRDLKGRRNYWAHQCFYSEPIFLTRNRESGEFVVKYNKDEKRIKKDYSDAKKMAEQLDAIYLQIHSDTGLSDFKTKELDALLLELIPVEISSIKKIDFFSGETTNPQKK